MNIAIVGSRRYPYLEDVVKLVQLIDKDDREKRPLDPTTIVSGGAKGVDSAAENEAIRLGMKVLSFRVHPVELDGYSIAEWHLGGQKPYSRIMVELPSWEDYTSALLYRNSLIAEHADRVVAFADNRSRGTSLTLDFAHANKRPIKEYGIRDFERLVIA